MRRSSWPAFRVGRASVGAGFGVVGVVAGVLSLEALRTMAGSAEAISGPRRLSEGSFRERAGVDG
jgi:hypothetical protein